MIHTDIYYTGRKLREWNCPVYVCPFYPAPAREINWPGKLQLMTHGRDEIAPTLPSRADPCFPDYRGQNSRLLPRYRRIKSISNIFFNLSRSFEGRGEKRKRETELVYVWQTNVRYFRILKKAYTKKILYLPDPISCWYRIRGWRWKIWAEGGALYLESIHEGRIVSTSKEYSLCIVFRSK